MAPKSLWILPLVVLVYPGAGDGAKLLLYPFPYYSHVEEMMMIGRGLMSRGHTIHLILPPSLPKVDKFRAEAGVEVLEYHVREPDWYQIMDKSSDNVETMLDEVLQMTPIQDFRENIEGFGEFCYNALSDQKLLDRVKREKYDLAIIDAFPLSRCHYIIPYKFNIPYISHVTQYEPWLSRTPALPSFVPFQLRSPPLSPKMSFLERFINLAVQIDWYVNTGIPFMANSMIARYAPEKPLVSLDSLASKSLLWLRNCDFVLDYPRPFMPNEVNVGGLSTKPAEKLPRDLQEFMDSGTEGVILASFGSVSLFPTNVLDIFQKAYEKLPYKVIQLTPWAFIVTKIRQNDDGMLMNSYSQVDKRLFLFLPVVVKM